jgi:hypothetical protein
MIAGTAVAGICRGGALHPAAAASATQMTGLRARERSKRPPELTELPDISAETTHRGEIETHLKRHHVPIWNLALEDPGKVAAHRAHVHVREHRVAIIADASHDLSSANRVADFHLDVSDVHVADLHGCVGGIAESLKQDGGRRIRASSAGTIRHWVLKGEPNDAVEWREQSFIPAEPIFVVRSIASVEAHGIAARAAVVAIGEAIASECITGVILRSKRMLGAGERGRQRGMNDDGVNRGVGRLCSPSCPGGGRTCDSEEQRAGVNEG